MPDIKVKTKYGVGHLIGLDDEHEIYTVRFDKKDYAPEEWNAICPSGGTCMFKPIAYRDVVLENQ